MKQRRGIVSDLRVFAQFFVMNPPTDAVKSRARQGTKLLEW